MLDGLRTIREFLVPFDTAWSAIEPAILRLRDLVRREQGPFLLGSACAECRRSLPAESEDSI
jgi:hypothetical protein